MKRDDWDVIADIYRRYNISRDPKLINISLPKTSSKSLVDYCKDYCYATHEAWHREITSAVVDNRQGILSDDSLHRLYEMRTANERHVVDSATFNHLLMEDIFSIYPNSSYIYIYRNCSSWTSSMLNMWNSFNTLHEKRLSDGQDVQSSREWISWINNYSTLYSSNLSTYFWRRSNQDINDPYFKKLSSDLMEFWIQSGERILKAKQSNIDLHTVPLSQSSEIPWVVKSVLGIDISEYPTSNKRVDDPLHLTADQISHIVPSSLLKKSESIYNQLLNS